MASQGSGTRVVALLGSVRADNYTGRALRLVVEALRARGAEVSVFDPVSMDIPSPGMGDTSDTERMQGAVEAAQAVLMATPEYHGSYSSVIKQLIENLGFPSRLKGKPVALLGVAAGRIGAIKALEHLRSVCSHVGALALPGAVSVPGVRKVFDDEGRCTDDDIRARLEGLADDLLDFVCRTECPDHAEEQVQRA